MKFTISTTLLSALAASQLVAAGTHSHKRHSHAERHAAVKEREEEDQHLRTRDIAGLLGAVSSLTGVNSVVEGATAWIGGGGANLLEFHNLAAEDAVLVLWGPWGSWVNAKQPQITVSMPANSSKLISVPTMSGGFAPIYKDTTARNGQIVQTWGEFTTTDNGMFTTYDVSREVYMKGRNMLIRTPWNCVSSMTQCVFVCNDANADYCGESKSYKIIDAEPVQKGCNIAKTYDDNATGGCTNYVAFSKANPQTVKVYFGYASEAEVPKN